MHLNKLIICCKFVFDIRPQFWYCIEFVISLEKLCFYERIMVLTSKGKPQKHMFVFEMIFFFFFKKIKFSRVNNDCVFNFVP